MKPEILRMILLSPLYYVPYGSTVLEFKEEEGEKLFCFEVEESQAQKFEPDKDKLIGSSVFVGIAANKDQPGAATLELKTGNYVFCQLREILDWEEIIELAVEVQNEGLWQRLQLDRRLYVRFLFEDGRGVTQIWRPFLEETDVS